MRPDLWDQALVAALPLAERARDDEDVVEAYRVMLGHLEDPLTRVVRTDAPATAAPPPGELFAARRRTILVVDLSQPMSQAAWQTRIEEIRGAMQTATAVIFDLRSVPSFADLLVAMYLDMLIPDLLARDVALPSSRAPLHIGYRSQTLASVVGESAFVTTPSGRLLARPGTQRRRVAFVLGPHSGVPRLALALQASGDGLVIAQGVDVEERMVTTSVPVSGTPYAVQMRVREVASADGRKVGADVSLPADAPRERALTLATRWFAGGAVAVPGPRAPIPCRPGHAGPAG